MEEARELIWLLVQLTIRRQMDRPRWSTEVWEIIEKLGDRAPQQLGPDIATGRVCVQRFGESEYRKKSISDFVWDTAKGSF
jgi:hypothetical protein